MTNAALHTSTTCSLLSSSHLYLHLNPFSLSPSTYPSEKESEPKSLQIQTRWSKMPRDYKLISEITNHTRNWTVKIKVNEKSARRQSQNSSKTYQRLTLSDCKGNRVQATIFDDDINILKNTLSPLKDYYISNAHVRTIEPRFRYVENNYQWIINNHSRIEEITGEEENIKEESYSFISFNNLNDYINSTAQIGISLSTRGSTTITINPEIPEAISLQTWSHEHNDVLNELREKITHIPMPNASTSTTININEVLESTEMNIVHCIKASVLITDLQQNFWYMGCSLCKKRTSEEYEKEISCPCSTKKATAQPRSLIKANLSDSTGTMLATLFGEQAEKIMSCTSIDLMQFSIKEHMDEIENLVNQCNGKEFIFRLKSHQYIYEANTDQRFNVISVNEIPPKS
ncbi:hypothetical protein HHK36_011154 [Tetracentron sinense]|uniref:Replication factor A C-terminal domain-containing protein n=1 Tax=Tetracentron sinense TaxID=13715 RepID=A0A834ZCA8_TETSI|nr:hypothetical protein HHK36_011154 [Tetracentron sinense]